MPKNKEEEIEVPKPTKGTSNPRILVVKIEDVPKVEVREGELEGQPVLVETIEEALTALRNDVREMKASLTG